MRRIGGGEKGLLVGSSSSTSCSTLFEHYVLFYVLFELSTQTFCWADSSPLHSHPQLPPWGYVIKMQFKAMFFTDWSLFDAWWLHHLTSLNHMPYLGLTNPFFIGFKSCMSQQLTTMEGKRGASLQGWIIWSEEQNQMEFKIRSWRPHSKHWMEGHLSIASQKPRSWHFNDHLIEKNLENVDFVLVNLAFKHTSSHNRSRDASLPASLTLWFESTFGFVGSAVLRTQTSEPSKSRERSFYLSCLGASLSFS